jgi:hypothetical protein
MGVDLGNAAASGNDDCGAASHRKVFIHGFRRSVASLAATPAVYLTPGRLTGEGS